MAKRTIGYVELEWKCPNCDTKNPGMQKTCTNCGAPQPENVQFGLGEQQGLIQDASKVDQAKKGADIHCPYCGTRNPGDAQNCSQCGGDLVGGAKRTSGMAVGAPAAAPSPAPAPAAKPSFFRLWMLLPVGICILAFCAVFGFLALRTEKTTGTVESVHWEHIVLIQELRDVTRKDWEDRVPRDATILSCDLEYRTRQPVLDDSPRDNPVANATEVCTSELVDQGNGAAEVVETCYYEVYDHSCQYTVEEWQQVDQSVAEGNDLSPYWPDVRLGVGQREGERRVVYTVRFQTANGIKEYTTDQENIFTQFQPGTTWTLEINALGGVVSVQP